MSEGKGLRYEDAAEKRSVTGWVCKTCSRFYGTGEGAEHIARWCCSTDQPCECGGRKGKRYTVCESCRQRKADERWAERERREWAGEYPLYAVGPDVYVFDESEWEDLVYEYGDDLRLLFCRPVYAREVEWDYWCDDLPDECSLEDVPWLAEAVERLNTEIRKMHEREEPLSWRPGETVAVMPGGED